MEMAEGLLTSAELVASIDGVCSELLLDPEDLVKLGQSLGTSGGTSLDLSS